MAVLPMKRVFICALKKDRKPVLELLQRMQVVQIESRDVEKEDELFSKQDKSEARALFERNSQTAQTALAILDKRVPENKSLLSSLEGRKAISVTEYEAMVNKRDQTMDAANRLIALDRECAENNAAVPKTEAQIVALEPWLAYDLPLNFAGTGKTTVFTGTLQNEVSLETIYERLNEFAPGVEDREVRIISSTQEQTWKECWRPATRCLCRN